MISGFGNKKRKTSTQKDAKKPVNRKSDKDKKHKSTMKKISRNRQVGDLEIFKTSDPETWEKEYRRVLNRKYQKNTRHFSTKLQADSYKDWKEEAPIFVIPRERTKSYFDFKLDPSLNMSQSEIQLCPISKGFSMQGLSSFTLGPFPQQGLCLVNVAFSKQVFVSHIEGGGKVNLARISFWQPSKKPKYIISCVDTKKNEMIVNHKKVNLQVWLIEHRDEWFSEWDKWRKNVALCSDGAFNWGKGLGKLVTYCHEDKFLNFVQWKRECYIKPSYQLLPTTKEFQFLKKLWKEKNIALGLVHPKARNGNDNLVHPIRRQDITNMFNCPYTMSCQPYIVAGCLMNVSI
jgi:hypothetical protein